MPRRSRRPGPDQTSQEDGSRSTGASGWQRRQSTADGEFLVRSIPGMAAGKVYRCPGCQQLIQPGTAHLVVWPVWIADGEGGLADRRHWHTPCWTRRATRGGPGRLS